MACAQFVALTMSACGTQNAPVRRHLLHEYRCALSLCVRLPQRHVSAPISHLSTRTQHLNCFPFWRGSALSQPTRAYITTAIRRLSDGTRTQEPEIFRGRSGAAAYEDSRTGYKGTFSSRDYWDTPQVHNCWCICISLYLGYKRTKLVTSLQAGCVLESMRCSLSAPLFVCCAALLLPGAGCRAPAGWGGSRSRRADSKLARMHPLPTAAWLQCTPSRPPAILLRGYPWYPHTPVRAPSSQWQRRGASRMVVGGTGRMGSGGGTWEEAGQVSN